VSHLTPAKCAVHTQQCHYSLFSTSFVLIQNSPIQHLTLFCNYSDSVKKKHRFAGGTDRAVLLPYNVQTATLCILHHY